MTQIERIKDILLHHKGAENAIYAAEVARLIGLPKEEGNRTIRVMIEQAIYAYGLPIASNHYGYFLIETPFELNHYLQSLNARVTGIEKRAKTIADNYKSWGVRS